MAAKAKATKKTAPDFENLVIVESPAKAKTIEKFLGKGYKVTASNGHLIDLPKSKIGVDTENNFTPSYIVIRGRTALLNELKKLSGEAKTVYLATDPDREGEAISWHLARALNIPETEKCRIEFNEITKKAVLNGISHPRTIDINKVDAQQARRVLDRLVGYKLSPLLWKKVKPGLSAGRVQSVAVRLIVDREDEIKKFVPREYWTLNVLLTKNSDKSAVFPTKLTGKNGKKFEPESEEQINEVLSELKNANYVIKNVKKGQSLRKPYAPFTTSTLQQEASKKLNFTARRTMMIAQGLYEGVTVLTGETVGLITYMRTDSTRISEDAVNNARQHILNNFGEEFLPEKPNVFLSKKNAQDAHEAIRPTYLEYTPEKVKASLTPEQFKLYTLIYNRFIACQMKPAAYETLGAQIDAASYNFRSSFSVLKFAGWKAAYSDNSDDEEEISSFIPDLKENDECTAKKLEPKQNFTAPPARYTEASLVKALEELGIGRPSTYAPIISTIIDRQYVKRDKKALLPTDLGEIVTKLMEENFSDIVNVKFTAQMENSLDDIAEHGTDWHKVISDFYYPFEKNLERAETEVKKVELPVKEAGVTCELCGAPMIIKTGRFGDFIACPNYPACKNTKPILKPIAAPCPKCGAQVLERKSKKGKKFYGCSAYPECDFISCDMPLEEKCPVCGKYMVKASFRGSKGVKRCSDPECPSNKKSSDKDSK